MCAGGGLGIVQVQVKENSLETPIVLSVLRVSIIYVHMLSKGINSEVEQCSRYSFRFTDLMSHCNKSLHYVTLGFRTDKYSS